MGTPIPAWGLYRLMKGLEAKAISGCLDVVTSDGPVTFGLRKGRLYQAESDVAVLGFGAYLVRARMVPDPVAAERLSSTRRLIEAGIIRPEDASKLHGSYVRSVLSRVLALPASTWAFVPADVLVGVVSDNPVDPFPELLRAVTREWDRSAMFPVIERVCASGRMQVTPGFEFSLSHARSHFGELKILPLLRQNRPNDITSEMLAEDDTLRVLFALIVAGLLHVGPAESVSSPPVRQAPIHADEPMVGRLHDPPPAPPVVPNAAPELPRRPRPTGLQNSIQLAGVSSPFEKELRTTWLEMQSRNHFEVLGVPVDARESAIVAAWMKARIHFARGRYEGVVPVEALDLVDKIQCHLESIRDVLTDRERRTQYNRQIGISTPSLDSRIVEICEARALSRVGLDLLQSRKPGDALAQFEAAVRQDPLEPDYKVFQATAILAMPPTGDNVPRARDLVEAALRVEPDLLEGLVCMASICRLEGRIDESREFVRRVLLMDPEHVEARAVKDLLRTRAPLPTVTFQKTRTSLIDRILRIFKN